MWEKPKDDVVRELILHDRDTTHWELLRRIICASEKVHTKGSELKRENATTKESYTQWVTERVQQVKLPFVIDPTYCPLKRSTTSKQLSLNFMRASFHSLSLIKFNSSQRRKVRSHKVE